MNASIALRTVVIAAVVAVPWIGCSLWSASRERTEKDALAAEIRAEIEARRIALPDEEPGLADLTEAYSAALRESGNIGVPQPVHQHLSRPEAWEAVPKEVSAFLEGRNAPLDGFAAAVKDLPPGRMTLDPDGWTRLGSIHGGLRVRGRVQATTGALAGLLETVGLLRRLASDAASATNRGSPNWPANMALGMERTAFDLLARLAVHPSLGEKEAATALALTGAKWVAESAPDRLALFQTDWFDQFCLELLSDDAWEKLKERSLVEEDSSLERIEGLLQGRSREQREGPRAPPRAAVLRRMREVLATQRSAFERRDAAAVRLGGPLDLQAREDLGEGWTAGFFSPYPWLGRDRWGLQARIAVLRAAFALRLHEIRGGGVPESLEALVPAVLDAIPVDRWTGERVRFTPRPDGWVLEAGHPDASYTHHVGWTEMQTPYRLEK